MDAVFAEVFLAVAPNFTNQPEAALEYVKQIFTDSDGKEVYPRSVQEYYSQIMGAIQPFVAQQTFPVLKHGSRSLQILQAGFSNMV